MTIEILHLDGVWRVSMLRDFDPYPGETEGEKVAWLNERCRPQRGIDIFRVQVPAEGR